MRSVDRRVVGLGLVVVLAVASLASPAAANGRTYESVCPVCGEPLELAAADEGVPLSVERSQLVIHVHRNGSARWTARVQMNDSAAERLRADPAMLDRIVAAAYRERRPGYGSVTVVRPNDPAVRMEGDTLVVSYTVEDVATRSVGGTIVVDFFHAGRGDRYFDVLADRLVIRGPDGWSVVNRPPKASVSAGEAVWTGSDVRDHTYVAIAPEAGPVSTVVGQLAIAVEFADLLPDVLTRVAFLPGLIAALVAGGLTLLGPRERLLDRTPSLAVALVGVPVAVLGALGAVATLGVGGLAPLYNAGIDLERFGPVVGPAVVVLGVAAVVSAHGSLDEWLDRRPGRGSPAAPDLATAVTLLGLATLALSWSFRFDLPIPPAAAYATLGITVATVRWPGAFTTETALVPVAAGIGVGLAVGAVAGGVVPANGGETLRLLGLVVPPLLFLPLGVAVRLGSQVRWAVAAAIVAGPVPVSIAMGPPGPFVGGVWLLLSVVWMVVQGAAGLPLYVLGRAVADEPT